MTDIQLYKPNAVDATIQFPTAWNDCTVVELKLIAAYIFLKKYTREELLIELIRQRLTKAKPEWSKRKINETIIQLDTETLAMEMNTLLNWIEENILLTEQPLKKIGQLYGPDKSFDDLTCGEFEDADACFNEVRIAIDEARTLDVTLIIPEKLIDLVACLWRPIDTNSKRIPYVDYEASADVKEYLRSLQPEMLLISLLWYMGCKVFLPRWFPLVMNTGGSEAPAEVDPMAVTKLIHHGAGPKNGTREQIRMMKLKEFFYDLQLEAEKDTIGN